MFHHTLPLCVSINFNSRHSIWLTTLLTMAVVGGRVGSAELPAFVSATADEPLATEFSLERAARALDASALAWQERRGCVQCHANLMYLIARPLLSEVVQPPPDVRQWFEAQKGGSVLVAAPLAFNDHHTTGKLHPATRKVLDALLARQRPDGTWYDTDGSFGFHDAALLGALGIAHAPEEYAQTEAAQKALAGVRKFVKERPAPTPYHRGLLLWAARHIEGLLADADRDRTVADLLALQGADGGWALQRLRGATAQEPSDGYGTGFVIFVLRQAGMRADDARLRKGIAWLKANQRASGRWFTRTPGRKLHLHSNSGTAFAVMALHACGEVPGSGVFRPLTGLAGFTHVATLGLVGREALGVSVTDMDADGQPDVCLLGAGYVGLWRNLGERLELSRLPGAAGARAAVWADYNGSGKPSLLLATAAGPKLFTNLGKQGFRDDSQLLPREAGYNLTAATWIDYDGDGRPDILLANGFHGLRLYRNKGPAANWEFEDVSTQVGLGPDGIGSDVKGDTLMVCDVNGDGRSDFLYGAGTGMLVLNTSQGFVEAKDSGISYKPGKVGPVFGDFDNSGVPGLFVPQLDGRCKLFKNDGRGRFTDVTALAGDLAQPMGVANCAAWGDVFNNGHQHLVVGCLRGPNRVFRNKGDGAFIDATEELGLHKQIFNTTGIGLVDLNNDGVLDLVLNNEGQPPVVLLGNAQRGGGKRTPLTVTVAGTSGVLDSRIRVLDRTGKSLGTQYITGGNGRGSQAAPLARFALLPGDYTVEVRYSNCVLRTQDISIAATPLRVVIDRPVVTAAQPPSSAKPSVPGDDWPQFRGPDGQGHSAARGLPLTWSEKENIAWKVEVPGRGNSSPVIQGEQIWLTAGLEGGRSLRALCLDRATGKLIHDVEVFPKTPPESNDPQRPHANPTPIIADGRLYVHFGSHGTACLTTDGKIIWKTQLPHALVYCPSSTPVLYKDLLIVPCHGSRERYLAALDRQTGEVRWKQDYKGGPSDSTPLVIQTPKGDQLVCNLAHRVVAYDPRTGEELWSTRQSGYANVPRPVHGHGLVFVCGGYMTPGLQAIRPDGRGDVTKTHVVWDILRAPVPRNPSPLLVGDELYLISDNGMASCLDARTGKLHWREELAGASAAFDPSGRAVGYYASPLYADGRIYFLNNNGETTVIAPGGAFKKLASNKLEGHTLASLAVSGTALYLRSDRHLYRIEKRGEAGPKQP